MSFEWQPGDVYGGAPSPAYNAITCTWGRWRLQEDELVEEATVGVVPIRGTHWPIPRVHTVQQFRNLLEAVTTLRPREIIHNESAVKEISFVRLDVACVD